MIGSVSCGSKYSCNDFDRAAPVMKLELRRGERRGYWKYHAPNKWFKQAKATGKIDNKQANLLFATGAETPLIDVAYACEAGCQIDTDRKMSYVGIGDDVYTTEGRTRVKLTLANELVYTFDAWIAPMRGQDCILGMDFMVPAGVRLDLADGSLCLPDEVRVRLQGRRQLYGDSAHFMSAGDLGSIAPGGYREMKLRPPDRQKLWFTRGQRWVPTVVLTKQGASRWLRITNTSDRILTLSGLDILGMWISQDSVPRKPGYVSVGSNRYNQWQNLAYQCSTDADLASGQVNEEPPVDRLVYPEPKEILKREHATPDERVVIQSFPDASEDNDSLAAMPRVSVAATIVTGEVDNSQENEETLQPLRPDHTIGHEKGDAHGAHASCNGTPLHL